MPFCAPKTSGNGLKWWVRSHRQACHRRACHRHAVAMAPVSRAGDIGHLVEPAVGRARARARVMPRVMPLGPPGPPPGPCGRSPGAPAERPRGPPPTLRDLFAPFWGPEGSPLIPFDPLRSFSISPEWGLNVAHSGGGGTFLPLLATTGEKERILGGGRGGTAPPGAGGGRSGLPWSPLAPFDLL
jgi:hypothetical protein